MMVQTEIGLLPEDWEVVQIGNVGKVITGSTPPTVDEMNYGHEFMFVSPADLGLTKYINKTITYLSKMGFSISRQLPEGAILYTCIGSTIGKIGIAGNMLATNQQINAIVPFASYNNEYVYYALQIRKQHIIGDACVQAVPLINKSDFSEKLISIPLSSTEQQNIATALSSIDKLIDDLGRTIQKKQRIREGAMEELLSGKKRLPGFTEEWMENTFDELFKPYSTASYSREEMIEGDVLCIHYGDIHTKYGPVVYLDSNEIPTITKEQAGRYTRLKDGDIIMADASEDYEGIGKCIAVITCGREAIAGLHTILLRPKANDLFDHRFTSYILSHRSTKKQIEYLSEGTKVNSISFNKIKVVTVTYPSSLKEQGTIADILTSMDDEISLLESERAKYEQIRSGMMEELLTGKKRLIKK